MNFVPGAGAAMGGFGVGGTGMAMGGKAVGNPSRKEIARKNSRIN